MKDKRKQVSAILKLFVLFIILIGVPVFLYFKYRSYLFADNFSAALTAFLNLHRTEAAWIIIGIQAIQVIICFIPGQPVQFASSYIFGIGKGYILSIAGALIGTFISFGLARLLGRDFIRLFFDEEKIDYYCSKLNSGQGLMAVLLIYLIPGIPKDIVSYIAGITNIGIRPFLIVSTAGRTPGMLGSLMFGHFFGAKNYKAIALLVAAAVILTIILVLKRKSLLDILDRIEAREEKRSSKAQ